LWALIDRLPRDLWPALLRGDCGFGNEGVMREAEARGLAYLFKLRLTKNVKRMIEKLSGARDWVDAGQGFEAKESAVRLMGWSRARRTIVLRRRVKGAVGLSQDDGNGAAQLSFAEISEAAEVYEYSVLVTSLDEETEAFGQLYRERGDGDIDQAWRLSRFCGWGGMGGLGPWRASAPRRRGRADGFQGRDGVGIGQNQFGALKVSRRSAGRHPSRLRISATWAQSRPSWRSSAARAVNAA
jgi:hypothetical protein